MKALIITLLISCVVAVSPVACKSPNKTAHRVVGSAVISVDAAMHAWGDYVSKNHPSVEVEQKVYFAYDRYQLAMLVVTDAGRALAEVDVKENRTTLDIALSAAALSLSDLVNLIRSFGVKL